jgi:hypothetical protein
MRVKTIWRAFYFRSAKLETISDYVWLHTKGGRMSNEPVAWRIKDKDGKWLYYDEPLVGTEPLYTHSISESKYSAAYEKQLAEAGGMIGVLREYISDLENGLESSIKLNKAQAERNK